MDIQAMIDRCAEQGGGKVTVPPGEYVTGMLSLRDNVELHLSAGAVIYPSEDPADFPEPEALSWNLAGAPRRSGRCLIYGDGVRNAAITGQGVIDCRGPRYCEPDPNPGRINALRRTERCLLPRVVLLACCERLTLRDFTVKDAPAGWSVWMTGCRDSLVQGVRLLADREMPNADGLHLNSCRDIRVSDCRFETGDDALVLRAFASPHFEPMPCEHITVTNCVLSSNSSAVRVGWCGDGVIRDCTLSNLTIHDSVNGLVFQLPYFETPASDQSTELTRISRISFSNIVMNRVFFEPIHLSVADRVRAELSDLRFDGIRSVSRRMPRFSGTKDYPIRDVTLRDCRFEVIPEPETDCRIPDQYWDERSFDGLPTVRRVERLRMESVEFNRETD